MGTTSPLAPVHRLNTTIILLLVFSSLLQNNAEKKKKVRSLNARKHIHYIYTFIQHPHFLPLHLVQTICRYISVFCLVKSQMKCTSLVQDDVVPQNKYAFKGR